LQLCCFSALLYLSQPLHTPRKRSQRGFFLSDVPSFVGESSYDNASFGLSSVGDVNGDGLQDFAVGAPNNDDGGVNVGKVYLYFGEKDKVWKKGANLADAPVTYIGEEKDDNAGSAVSGIGDVNGDGLDDFAICARNNSQGGDGAGKVYLVFGKRDGWQKKNSLSEVFPMYIGEMEEDNAGAKLAAAGDVNGDGLDDFLIGCPKNDEGGEDSGAVYIIWGHRGIWKKYIHLNRLKKLGIKLIGETAYDQTGNSISMAGDVNGDGFGDVIIGSEKEGEGGKSAGAAYLLMGRKDGWNPSLDLAFIDLKIYGDKKKAKFGYSVSLLGDINGDGFSDIGVGATASSKGGKKIGRVSIFMGNKDFFSVRKKKSSTEDVFIVGQKKKDQFGYALSYLGDINKDGLDDFAVSSTRNSDWKKKAGKVYVFFGREKWEKENSAKKANMGIRGEKKRDYSGTTISFVGDTKGDGSSGFLVASDSSSANGRSSGKAYIIYPFKNKIPTNIKTFSLKSDKSFKENLHTDLGWGETLYVEAVAEDTEPKHRNTIPCMVKNSDTNNIIINLNETEKNSGVFRGRVTFGHTSSSMILREIRLEARDTLSLYPLNLLKLKKTVGLKIAASNIDIDDDLHGKSMGNSNKRVEKGEKVEIYPTFVNYNAHDAKDVVAKLDTKNQNIKILVAKASFGDISSGSSKVGEPFVVLVEKDAPKDFLVKFHIRIESSDGRFWEDHFKIKVENIYTISGSVFDINKKTPVGHVEVRYGKSRTVFTDDSGKYNLFINKNMQGKSFYVKAKGYLKIASELKDWGGKSAVKNFMLSKRVNMSKADASFVGIDLHETAGYSIGTGGDVNGDGYDDIIVGTWACSRGGISAGCSYLLLGRKGGWEKRISFSESDASFLGEAPYDESGRKVAIVQDINGDGLDDILIGAPGNDENGDKAGKMYIIFGSVSGWKQNVRLSDADSCFIGEDPYDRVGYYVSSVGDVNGDGLGDIGVGAWSSTDSGMDAGQSYIIFGRKGYWPKKESMGRSDTSFLGEKSRDESGRVVTGIGDVNADGLDDFIIGAPASSAFKDFAGKAFLFFGTREDLGWRKSLSAADASYLGEDSNDSLGSAISYIGDVNGDGIADFAFGAWSSDAVGKDAGKVYVVFGKKEGWKTNQEIAKVADASFVGEKRGDAAGTSIASLGDYNGDGIDDFIISSPRNGFGSPGAGQVYIIFGHRGKWEQSVRLSYAQRSYLGMNTNDYAGYSLSSAGDINNDGSNDVVVSAWGNDDGGMDTGQVYIFLGKQNIPPKNIAKISLEKEMVVGDLSDDFSVGDWLTLKAEGEDSDPSSRNWTSAVLTGSSYIYDFEVPLLETGNNTGVFTGKVLLSETSASVLQRRMKVNGMDYLSIISNINPNVEKTIMVHDNKEPFIRRLFPLPNSMYVPVSTDIRFHIFDYGCGVNPASLVLKVNDKKIKYEFTEQNDGEYYVVYNPTTPFEYKKEIKVHINASDKCEEPNYIDKKYVFTTASNGNFRNGGFERGLFGWRVTPFASVKIETDVKVFHSGKASCKFSFMGENDLYYDGFSSGAIPVRPSTKYSLVFWIKTENITSNSGVRIYLEGTNHPDRYFNLNDYFNEQSKDLLDTNDWTRMIMNFSTLENTHFVVLYLIRWKGGGMLKGSCWIDDFALASENESGYTVPGFGESLRNLFK